MKIKLAGRNIQPSQTVSKLLELAALWRRFHIFKKPTQVFKAYLTKKNVPEYLELKNGFKVYLSSHPEDIVTAVVVFCKHDYGTDFAGKNIIDIGANIGTFSLFAALEGAKKVVAIEPAREAYETFERSISANSLQDVVLPVAAAVTRHDGNKVHFPTQSSPNNTAAKKEHSIAVNTISLATLIQIHFTAPIDLLKIDCEGGEYDILYNTPDNTLKQVKQIRMELHGAAKDKQALLHHLQQKGFRLDSYQHDNAWLTNTRT
jgi:FkbM family methyltransferase